MASDSGAGLVVPSGGKNARPGSQARGQRPDREMLLSPHFPNSNRSSSPSYVCSAKTSSQSLVPEVDRIEQIDPSCSVAKDPEKVQ